jgi:AcrR family transcriptional regulator
MKQETKVFKENLIIQAAETVFRKMGFKNAKMEDIAFEAGITKVTLYTYFQSKENLYMALTYKAFQRLLDGYYASIEKNKHKSGLESSLALMETSMNFFANNFLYSEALLDYFNTVRSSDSGQNKSKLTEAINQSLYFNKLQDIHNLPFKLNFKEIERGKLDGSIISQLDSMLITLQGWSMVTGFAKILSASGNTVKPLFNIDLNELKNITLITGKALLLEKGK